MNKTEESWGKLFEEHEILKKIEKKGFFEITSKQINKYRESRLMAKFDHKSNLPEIFLKNKLSILPITRGSYIISTFDAYQKLQVHSSEIEFYGLPENIDSIDPHNLYSESAALHCAYLSGMIDDVLEEDSAFTISGRMSTSKFSYMINIDAQNPLTIQVTNSQCEIDGGFESKSKLAIIEVKNFLPRDFIVRQLFYPYRLWKNKFHKEIVPVFMTYSNDVFSFFIYEFKNESIYNSIHLIKQKNFMISEEKITLDDIIHCLNSAKIVNEPEVPFPQADSFARIIDLLGLLYVQDLDKEEITLNYDFDKRQTDYYTNAAIYLGLIEKTRKKDVIAYTLTSSGRRILSQKHKAKNLDLIKLILSHRIFNESLKLNLQHSCTPTKHQIIQIMKRYPPYKVSSERTFERRASTVIGWIYWIYHYKTMNDKITGYSSEFTTLWSFAERGTWATHTPNLSGQFRAAGGTEHHRDVLGYRRRRPGPDVRRRNHPD